MSDAGLNLDLDATSRMFGARLFGPSSLPVCQAFDLYLGRPGAGPESKACYIFRGELAPPFAPVSACLTCVKKKLPLKTEETSAGAQRGITVWHPKTLPAQIGNVTRTELTSRQNPGAAYKPYIAVMPGSGDLVVISFCAMGFGPYQCRPFGTGKNGTWPEHAVIWRSTDFGKTFSQDEDRTDMLGREFSLSVLRDGTMLAPFATADDRLTSIVNGLYRSTDAGKTWKAQSLLLPNVPVHQVETSWSVIERPDGHVLLGMSGNYAHNVFLKSDSVSNVTNVFWSSTDSGATWNTSYLHPDIGGWSGGDMFFGQSTSTCLRNGTLLHAGRLGTAGNGLVNKDICFDEYDGMYAHSSSDNGKSWRCLGCRAGAGDQSISEEHPHPQCAGLPAFGSVGEMYPRFLELKDGRILLTFTVRCGQDILPPVVGPNSTRMCAGGTAPLNQAGVCYYHCNRTVDGHGLELRAVLSTDGGTTFDFESDRLILGEQPPIFAPQPSGGGYGNTVETGDGWLLSTYSWRDDRWEDYKPTHIEMVRWKLPPALKTDMAAKTKAAAKLDDVLAPHPSHSRVPPNAAVVPNTMVWDGPRLLQQRQAFLVGHGNATLLVGITAVADKQMETYALTAISVVNKSHGAYPAVPPSGDVHDYFGVASCE
jgi:hypothetical protein